jgi:hypothetical protein
MDSQTGSACRMHKQTTVMHQENHDRSQSHDNTLTEDECSDELQFDLAAHIEQFGHQPYHAADAEEALEMYTRGT